jgi:hypothetical protein
MNKHDDGAAAPIHGALAAQIDRLVSGDLHEGDRRSLLAWLDEEPTRWRACALAFLEAQVWEQAAAIADGAPSAVGNALRGVPGEGEAPAEPRVQGSGFRVQSSDLRFPTSDLRRPTSGFRWGWLAIAGAVLAAFAAGALAGRGLISSSPHRPDSTIVRSDETASAPGPQLATVSVRTHLDPRLTAQVQLPVEPTTEPLAGASSISEYDRKLWERRGYEVVEETRYLPAKMPDGRTVIVPVNRVHLKLKGTPVS